jgi:plastocyanin
MRNCIGITLIIALLLFTGCNKATVAPIAADVQQPSEKPNSTEEKMPEVPEEWKGKTIKEIMNQTNQIQPASEVNETPDEEVVPAKTGDTEAYKVSQGTTIVELRKTESTMVFFPNPVKIKVGETVRWINGLDYLNKQAEVTIYSYLTGIFRSEKIGYGQYFEYTFEEKGNFTYNALPYQTFFKRGTIVVG